MKGGDEKRRNFVDSRWGQTEGQDETEESHKNKNLPPRPKIERLNEVKVHKGKDTKKVHTARDLKTVTRHSRGADCRAIRISEDTWTSHN